MKKFSFRLEGLLKIRRFQEEKKRAEMAALQAKVQNQEKVLFQMYEKIEKTYQLGLEYKLEGSHVPSKLDRVDWHIYGEKKKIFDKSNEIRKMKQDLERKEYEWFEVHKNVKMLEKMKEKKHAEYKKELKKKEQKKLDDMVNTREKMTS